MSMPSSFPDLVSPGFVYQWCSPFPDRANDSRRVHEYRTEPDRTSQQMPSRDTEIIRPKRKEYEVIFEVKEKLWVKYETITNTFSYNKESVERQVYDGYIGCFDGPERPNSREVYDSEFLDENAYVTEI